MLIFHLGVEKEENRTARSPFSSETKSFVVQSGFINSCLPTTTLSYPLWPGDIN